MIGLVMAGGKGTRMDLPEEKLLLKYKKPIILHVIDALIESNCFSKIFAVTSPNSPKTKKILQDYGIEILETPGNGYVEDLNYVIQNFDQPAMVTSGDLPLLDSQIVKEIVSKYDSKNIWTSIIIFQEYLQNLNLSNEYTVIHKNVPCCFTGISLVDSNKITDISSIKENFVVINNKKIAFNLNTKKDFELLSTA